MQISINSDPRTAWRLPVSPMEFKLALQVMGKDMEAALPENILLELALLSDAEMAELNESYLDCAGPTNVLAFPAPDASWRNTPDKKNLPHQSLHKSLGQTLGWMALAPVTLRREALLYKQNLSIYTLRLLAHGFAHLMGYEHGELMDEVSAKAARAAQLELFAIENGKKLWIRDSDSRPAGAGETAFRR